MNSMYPYCADIHLHVKGRISEEDAARQDRTARDILKRLSKQPGLILADEVGMGKTFVALAVAVSVALENRGKRPVVVMVPSSLKDKWPADFSLFCEKCLPANLSKKIRGGQADRAVQFLKFLDDPADRRKSVIFLTHGAMSQGLNDQWVMLALIWQSLHRRKGVDQLRCALCRVMGELLQMKWVDNRDSDLWETLLATHPSEWLKPIQGVIEEEEDDPVPEAVWKVLPELNTDEVYNALKEIPLRKSKNFHDNVVNARRVIKDEVRKLWKECLTKTRFRLPLLILDEAHHLKNADTRLASLFRSEDAQGDADEISRGPLAGVFERMLFLTATPFQLGHGELCSVLDRFDGISWSGVSAPECGREGFAKQRVDMRETLDAAQEAAVALDHAWGRLKGEDLAIGNNRFKHVDQWWPEARKAEGLTQGADDVVHCFERTKVRMGLAEKELRRWVIRHLKSRQLPGGANETPRRKRFIGKSILLDCAENEQAGIAVGGEDLLPFLLAARATSKAPDSRPVFAEGLASSYEAFLHTRRNRLKGSEDPDPEIDTDDEGAQTVEVNDAVKWYLDHLESLLPRDGTAEARHPKVDATIRRAVDAWRRGEKVVVFCHYIATGRILRQRISEAIRSEIRSLSARKLGCTPDEVEAQLDLLGKRFFDEDSPIRRACDAQALELLAEFPDLAQHSAELVDIVRRNVRTPSFLARFFPLERDKRDEEAMRIALDTPDLSGLTLRTLLRQFMQFLVERCGKQERQNYIQAVKRIQTGTHFGVDVAKEYDDDELQGAQQDYLVPNVRLVNGTTRSDTRRRIMLTFNTPFYPEILVASSVMAEGVDLHLNCRYVLHHDLCWNPSTLEQRTGRVDRIGAKAEMACQPIHIYIPFIAETQDEKMYRVVMDRERWFSVVMGEDYKVDTRTTEKLSSRIPLPAAAASELAFKLESGDA
ncbi:MAG: helicase-related protein [Armatimonadota bacterium]